MKDIQFSFLKPDDFNSIVGGFLAIGWNKPKTQFEKYYQEQTDGFRSVFVCKDQEQFAGYVTIIWKSAYPGFNSQNIPEISDLNVLPKFRKNGLGTEIVSKCEKLVQERGYSKIGLGVGLLEGYGSAQRLYVRMGYMPDGRGLHYGIQSVAYNEPVNADDDLVIYLTKEL